MPKTEPRTLSGFMELLPNEQILFNKMLKIIEETYNRTIRSSTCESRRGN